MQSVITTTSKDRQNVSSAQLDTNALTWEQSTLNHAQEVTTVMELALLFHVQLEHTTLTCMLSIPLIATTAHQAHTVSRDQRRSLVFVTQDMCAQEEPLFPIQTLSLSVQLCM